MKKKTPIVAAKRRKKNKGIVLIKKANNLIESRYKFDIWETRFFLSVLSQIKRSDTDFFVYRIWYKDIIKNFGLSSGDSYDLLRSAAKSLMGKSFFVSYASEGAIREKQYHILREIDYLKGGQEGRVGASQEYIDVTIESKMKPFLLELQRNFTSYDIQNIVHLNVYPIRLYELLKQYESIGSRKLEVEEIKRMLELGDQYKLFGDFHRWVIKPAVKAINAHTDLKITRVDKIKEGRKIIGLTFVFHSKKREEEPTTESDEDIPLADLRRDSGEEKTTRTRNKTYIRFAPIVVKKFGVTAAVFQNLCKEKTEAQVEQAVRVTFRAKANVEIKTSVAGFFVNALRVGFTDAKEEAFKRKTYEEAKLILLQKLEKLKQDMASATNNQIRKLIDKDSGLTERAILALTQNPVIRLELDEKELALGRPMTIQDYREDKTLVSLVKGKIAEFYPEVFDKVHEPILKEFETVKNELKNLETEFLA